MTRTYALKRLLEHGPLTWGECLDIMGGNREGARRTLETLVRQKIAKPINKDGKRLYALKG